MKTSDVTAILMRDASTAEEALREAMAPLAKADGFDAIHTLYDAMAYSLFAGGKRIRPCLVLSFCRLCGGKEEHAKRYAAAIEMIHTFSLIHDDMPCMDDDDLRRGKPTNHKVFGEATALLAGDALTAFAFETLSGGPSIKADLDALHLLARCTGPVGMCGGQQIDLENEGKPINAELLQTLHAKKTGALIRCACLLGCLAAGKTAEDAIYKDAAAYAEAIGLAFQIADDILDVTGDESKLGKKNGSDEKDGKTTYVTLYGLEGAKERALAEAARAKEVISRYEGSEFLCALADYIVSRDN